jgi:phage nucleotide-binding protein
MLEIKNTQKDYEHVAKINMLVYGAGGVGKSTFGSTFPKPILFDFENGAKYFKQRGIDIDVIQMKKWFDAEDKAKLASIVDPYETIIIDPIGEAMEILKNDDSLAGKKFRQADGSLTIAGWGELKDRMRTLIKYFRNTGKHVLIIAHVDEKQDEESLVKRPMMLTKLSNELINMVDIVGYFDVMKTDDGEEKRVIRVNPESNRYIAKDRTGALDLLVKPDFDYIYNMIKEKQTEEEPKNEKKKEAPKEEEKEQQELPSEEVVTKNPFDNA